MVNVFGDREDRCIGPQGPHGRTGTPGPPCPSGHRGSNRSKGDPGKDGIEEIYRFPNMLLKQFREEEEEDCFLLADPKEDVKCSIKEVK